MKILVWWALGLIGSCYRRAWHPQLLSNNLEVKFADSRGGLWTLALSGIVLGPGGVDPSPKANPSQIWSISEHNQSNLESPCVSLALYVIFDNAANPKISGVSLINLSLFSALSPTQQLRNHPRKSPLLPNMRFFDISYNGWSEVLSSDRASIITKILPL